MSYQPRLRKKYLEEIVPQLTEKFNYTSVMQVPKLEKICINRGVGEATQDKKLVAKAVEELTLITGQEAVQTIAKVSISNFKLREGMPIGTRVTLRNERMYEFLDRLISVALPRVRDFRGVKKNFDGRGNFTIGITEQIIFPEIDIDKIDKINGFNITFVTSADSNEEAEELMTLLGMPFKK
jgi:large subunit ribosomal protein L5